MPHYKKVLPVIQSGWYTCWAASMSWWTHALSDRGRPVMTEQEVMDAYPYNWEQTGAMTMQGLDAMLRDPKFAMNRRWGDQRDMDKLVYILSSDPVATVGAFPMLVGYNDPDAGGNHVAVICEPALDASFRTFIVMDPRLGKYVERTRDYLASNTMMFAWPNEATLAL